MYYLLFKERERIIIIIEEVGETREVWYVEDIRVYTLHSTHKCNEIVVGSRVPSTQQNPKRITHTPISFHQNRHVLPRHQRVLVMISMLQPPLF